MAKEIDPIIVPSFDFNAGGDYRKWHAEQLARFISNADPDVGNLKGSLLQWPVADGYALYVVKRHSPLTVARIDIGDGYAVSPIMIRGLRVSDVREQLRRRLGLAELFSKKP